MRQLWALALLAASTIAGAATGQTVHLDAVDVFDAAARATAAGRIAEALDLYDALAQDPAIDIRSEARFRKAQLLAAQHRYREAATVYRRLLDEQPDAPRVRIELAALLARLGDEPGARRQLRLAQAGKLPPEVASQLVQFSRALRSPQRFGGSIDVALAPDSNANRGTQARTLDTVIAPLMLDADARAAPGIGIRLRPSGFAKQPVSDRVSLVVRASGSADLYGQRRFDDVTATLLGGVEWRGGRDQVNLSYGGSKRWYGGDPFADSRSVTGEWLHQLDGKTQLSSSFGRTALRYRRNSLQDGPLYDASLTAERALTPRTGVAFGVAVTRQDAVDPSYAAWAGGPLVYAWHDLGRVTLFGSMNVRRLVGDERNFLFPDTRREWFLAGRVGAVVRKLTFHGFSPTARVGFERNVSTVSIYDYRRIYGELGLTRTF